jgi:DNA helicase-2/ATP-dependent DNA helicase PcrA
MDDFDRIFAAPEHTLASAPVKTSLSVDPELESRLLAGLNPEQAAAVRHDQGPLLVLAGAGSGKTRVITHRIAWLIRVLGVRPAAILAITFTNKAAAEMKSRIEELVGPVSQTMWVGTFHAMMVRILRRYADRLGYDRNFSIIDSEDQLKVIKQCLTQLNLDEKIFAPKAVHSQISAAKNALISPADFARQAGQEFRQRQVAQVYQRYQSKLKQSNSMDFDDILFEAVRLLQEQPDVLADYQQRFQYILVDEYQDTNHAQYQLVHLLSARSKNLCVVGDDDQSIYSFRGANIQNILDFEKDFQSCRVIKLEQNYRSTGTVLKAANAVIDNNRSRKAKSLWTSCQDGDPITFLRAENHYEEGRYLAAEIERLVAFSGRQRYRDIAILYRLNALSRSLEQALREQGIPYRIYGGVRFFDRREIKDVLAYLRLIITPQDDLSLTRIINVPRRGIGDATLAALAAQAVREGSSQLAVCAHARTVPELQRMAARLEDFAALIARLRTELDRNDRSLADYLEWVESETGLIQELVDQRQKGGGDGDAVDRIENLKELLSDAVEFASQLDARQAEIMILPEDADLADDQPSAALPDRLRSFLERAALYSEMDADQAQQDTVRLMTIHSAKGLEFGTVFLIGAEEGLFPGYRAMGNESDIEEERRLAYVAITRARLKLYVLTARTRIVFGQTQSFSVSRFVREIPAPCVEEIGGARQERYRPEQERPAAFPGAPQPVLRTVRPAAPQPLIPQQATPGTDAQAFKSGDRVRHPRFGPGKIISAEAVAGDAILLIEFGEAGRKRLMARMAGLTKL